jgi:hypothetical protein
MPVSIRRRDQTSSQAGEASPAGDFAEYAFEGEKCRRLRYIRAIRGERFR